jgi:hypothetical protein
MSKKAEIEARSSISMRMHLRLALGCCLANQFCLLDRRHTYQKKEGRISYLRKPELVTARGKNRRKNEYPLARDEKGTHSAAPDSSYNPG